MPPERIRTNRAKHSRKIGGNRDFAERGHINPMRYYEEIGGMKGNIGRFGGGPFPDIDYGMPIGNPAATRHLAV